MFRPHVAEGDTSDARTMEGHRARYFSPIGTLPAEVDQLCGSKDCDHSCQETVWGATNEVSLAPVVH